VCLQFISVPPKAKPKTPLSLAIHTRMQERGVSIQELADATGVGYERARTAVTGDEPPGKRLLGDICRFLKLDVESMSEMLITENVKRKYGRIPTRLTGADPELQTVEELWQHLLPEEKEHIAWLVSRYSERRTSQKAKQIPVERIGPRPARTP
jgi:transcriptional regulator with XRE-family HTH domain